MKTLTNATARLGVLGCIVMTALVGATVTDGAGLAAGFVSPPALEGGIAHSSGDDGEPEGDDDDGPIDCSIPDNQDDTGCDTGDVQDSQGAIGAAGDVGTSSGGADNIVPRGGVQTGAGGTASRPR
jgi:hypothetical protein